MTLQNPLQAGKYCSLISVVKSCIIKIQKEKEVKIKRFFKKGDKKMKNFLIKGIAALMIIASLSALPIYATDDISNENKIENELSEISRAQKSKFIYDFPENAASVSIELDGRQILDGEAAIINSVTYVPLRSFSELAGANSIEWDAKNRVATVKKSNTTVKISDRLQYVEASGRYFYSSEPIKNISDRLFVPIRLLCSALCVDVKWNAASRTVELKSTNKTLTSGSSFYSSDDVYWLSRIIHAESGGEPLLGKIAVGNVVLNRKESKMYPNTIYGVIFDRKNGTQFSPVSMGTIYNTPSAESVVAAKICLEGYSVDSNILFFMNPKIATNNWIAQNRPFAFKIGNHYFFY